MDQIALDREIKIARLDADIGAYRAKILDEKRRVLEANLMLLKVTEVISELEAKIASKEAEKNEI